MTQLTAASTPQPPDHLRWTPVCKLRDILPGGGVCALVGGRQVALFRVAGRLFALSNFDPFTRAQVLSRGLTGSYTLEGQVRYKVASPLLKHAFDLETGQCLSDPAVSVAVYTVRAEGGQVLIGDTWTGSAD
ncbi:nitrite reductase small subunit NirD [Deinococcus sp.]|uniref:nitrite reductase small subunit NirD n=1 Tax=Deinococcus sp. TaxID=47478 RepID=UPI003CC634D9